jgi:hypothetical protein
MSFDPRIYTSHGLNATVIAKLPNGELASGTVEWLTSNSLQVELDVSLNPTDLVELRVELQGLGETVYIQAAVARSRPANAAGLAAAIFRIIDMPLKDHLLLQQWVEDHAQGGTSSNPGSLFSLSNSQTGGGRNSIREGLRAGLRLPPQS